MSIFSWFNKSSTDYQKSETIVTNYYYVPSPSPWYTVTTITRVRPFYYCSRPAKRWKNKLTVT